MPHFKIVQRSVPAENHLKFDCLSLKTEALKCLETSGHRLEINVVRSQILIQVKFHIVMGPQNFPKT
jgi:hypothetical protein